MEKIGTKVGGSKARGQGGRKHNSIVEVRQGGRKAWRQMYTVHLYRGTGGHGSRLEKGRAWREIEG